MNTGLLPQLLELNIPLNEAKVYLALLETGQTSAGEIIKKTGLHRSVIYESLSRLIDRKLVFKLEKQKIAHFQATDPERLLQKAKDQVDIAADLIPQLKGLVDITSPEITIYEGIEEYRRFWLDSVKRLPVGSTDYVAGSIGAPWVDYLGPISKQYFRVAEQRKIKWKMVVFDVDDLEQAFLSRRPKFEVECRLINKKVSKEGNFNVFANESVVLHSAVEPMIIEIKNSSLVRVFRNIFDILWETGKPLKKKE